MATYQLSQIKIFRAVDAGVTDNSALYAMIDAGIVTQAKAGLTAPQQAVIDGYVYVPSATDFTDRAFPKWAGNDPAPVYFKVTGTVTQQDSAMQSALAKWYK